MYRLVRRIVREGAWKEIRESENAEAVADTAAKAKHIFTIVAAMTTLAKVIILVRRIL